MDTKVVAQIFAVLELLSALPFYGIYTMAIHFYDSTNYFSLSSVSINTLGVLFLVLPLLAVVGLWKGWRSAYLWMGLYPVVAFTFGVVPIPFANYLYSDNTSINAVFIGAIDAIAVIFVAWLFVKGKARSNKRLQIDAAPPRD